VNLWYQTFFSEAWAIHVLLLVGHYPKKQFVEFYLLQAHLFFRYLYLAATTYKCVARPEEVNHFDHKVAKSPDLCMYQGIHVRIGFDSLGDG
jgi:hypothetical protein